MAETSIISDVDNQEPPPQTPPPQQPPVDKVKALYDAVSQDYDLGDFNTFKTKLQDPQKQEAFYNSVGKDYDLGTLDEFKAKVSGGNQSAPVQHQPTTAELWNTGIQQDLHQKAVAAASTELPKVTQSATYRKAAEKINATNIKNQLSDLQARLRDGTINQDEYNQKESEIQSANFNAKNDVDKAVNESVNNEPLMRRLLVKTSELNEDKNPEKAGKVEKNAYLIDSKDRGYNAQEILDNADKIEKRQLKYNIATKQLTKPDGNPFITAYKAVEQRNKDMDLFNYFSQASPAEAAITLRGMQKTHDPDKPTDKPSGFWGNVGEMVGSNLVPLVGGAGSGTAAALVGGPEAAPVGAGAFNSIEMARRGWINSFMTNVNDLTNKGADPEEAVIAAKSKANIDASIDAATGAVMGYLGTKAGMSPKYSPIKMSEGYKNVLTTIAKNVGKFGVETTPEGGVNALLAAGGQGLKNINDGKNPQEGTTEAAMSMLLLHYSLAGVGALKKTGLTPEAYEQNLNGIAKLPPDKVNEAINREVLSGTLTKDQANEKTALIQKQRDLNSGLPDTEIPQESKEKIQALKEKRDELEWQIHNDNPNQVDKAFHKGIKENIEGIKKTNADGTTEGSDGINEQIRQLSKGEKPNENAKVFVEPIDRAKEIINEKAVNGKIGQYDVSDPDELLKHIAEQAHGGSMLEGKFISTRPGTEEMFGKELTDIATKLHPEHIISESKAEDVTPGKGESIIPNSDKIHPVKDLQTWDLGDMAGKPEDEAAKKHLEGVVRDWDVKPAGKDGEAFGTEFLPRVISHFDQILKSEPNNTTVITHSSVLKAYKVWDAMGRPDISKLTPEQKTEFSNEYNKEETHNADLETFKGTNGDIHVIRHGQTEDNAKNNFRSGDTNLTEKGIKQAEEVGQQLKEKTGGDVPKIITSDLPRAVHTSNLINDELSNKIKNQDNAIQQQTTNEVGVRNEATVRSGVGGQDSESEKSTGQSGRSGQPATEEKGKTEEEKTDSGSDLSGIKNDISRPERAQRKLPEVELPKMGSDTDILNEGKNLVDIGKINPRELVSRINSDSTSTFTPNEAKAMQYYMRQLKTLDTSLRQELASATEESHRIDVRSQLGQLDDEMDAATTANLKGGNDWGQIGNIRQIVVDEGFNASRQKAAIKDAYGGEIPKDVKAKIDTAFKERDAALEEKNKLEEQLKQKQAELNTEKMKKAADRLQRDAKRTKTKEQLKAEEKDLLDELKKAFKRDLGNAHAGIPIPVGTVEALGKLAINYLRQGVNDLGAIVDKIHDNIKDEVEGVTKQDIRDLLARYKPLETEAYMKDVTKLEAKSVNLEKKVGTVAPKREKLLFEKDTRWMKANQKVIDAEYKIKQQKQKAYNSKQNWFQKTLGWANHLMRLSILSGKTVLAKLSAQATIGSLASREVESFTNHIWSVVIPKIGEKADIEGYYNAKANAKFYSEFFNAKKFAESAVEIAKTGSSSLTKERENVIYEHTPLLDMPTDLHTIIKDPPKRAAYEWALEHVLTGLEKKGIDINNPLVLEGAKDRAFTRAKYEIFLEDNSVSRKFAEWEAENRAGGNIGAVKSFLLHFVFPVSKVPTNIARRVGAHVAGIPLGAYKAREAFSKGIDNLSPDEANQIIRLLSKGTIGWALFGVGLYGAHKVFGGVYNKEIKDKKGKLEPSELGKNKMLVGNNEVPEAVQHAIPLQVMQLGATYRIIHDHYQDAGAGELESNFKAAVGSTAAVASNIPVVETPIHLAGALFNEPGERKKFEEDMKRRVEPQILRETGVIKPDKKSSELEQK